MIRRALLSENSALTNIAFASKGYWGYPQEYFQVWNEELTITLDYLRANLVYVYEILGKPAAFYSIVNLQNDIEYKNDCIEAGIWLDHMFIHPDSIRRGIGRQLFNHFVGQAETHSWYSVKILSDPNARGFYETMGCTYLREFPSSIGGRTTPLLEFHPGL